jgi:CheY-like chemotaxis protein
MSARARQSADPPILIVEDKDSLRTMLRHALEAQGHRVVEARDQPEAEAALAASHPAVVLSDLRLTEGDGFGVLRASKESDPELPVIVMTAYGSIQDAVAAMKEGALDFLAKPVDPEHLLLMVERALAQRRLATENLILREELAQRRGASTAPRSRRRCSKPSSSATRRAPSPAPHSASRASSSSRTAAPCSSTKSATCRWRSRRKSCVHSRRKPSSASAARCRCASTCAWWRRPTAT